MDYTKIIEGAFEYSKEGLLVRGGHWLKLILALILLTLPLLGYSMRIYRGATPAPKVDGWGKLFIDGIKLFMVGLVYSIPVITVQVIIYAGLINALLSGQLTSWDQLVTSSMGLQPAIGLLALMYILEIILLILLPIATIRLARTNSFAAAFNIGAILEYIGKIGWLTYILALLLISIVVGFAVFIIGFVIALGVYLISSSLIATLLASGVLLLIIMPPVQVFRARYFTQVYDSVAPAE
ncbi:MAG: hypothetical protein METHP_01735 [Methanoregula sp. SKADARSKE-2]|nr:MAG: hypothetical protein METHP_01735 [Methanoregula sp. SKADARSKE-2]